MNLNTLFLKSFRVLLLPFALLYGLVITIRNRLYDKGYLRSATFNFPLICVGNLAVGGTGKSPMVEYIVGVLHRDLKVATLSRGYKRKTRGYLLANDRTTALEIGDEPMQFHVKFPDVAVAVGEERLDAVPQLLHDRPDLQVVVLDDAFQHRVVKAGLNILLTEYANLFTYDIFLPTGDLRDERSSYRRADVIVVSKCPPDLDIEKKRVTIREIQPLPHQKVFFTTIDYGIPYHIASQHQRSITKQDEILLVCGIANPQPLKDYIFNHSETYYQLDYSDHHIFTIDDLNEIRRRYERIDAPAKFIVTTEKDAMRFMKFSDQLTDLPLYVLPIRHKFLFNEGRQFDDLLMSFVRNFKFTSNEQEKG
ncbi:MAG: lpxK [Chitinophagaceae bacterium]|nr:lpxK [Chitinophagaceae bacterium]